MNEILVPGAKDRADLIEKLKAALQTCNLCEDKIVMEFPDGMWGDEFRGIVQSVMPEIEANLERHGGYMCDAENFSITGQEYLPIYCQYHLALAASHQSGWL